MAGFTAPFVGGLGLPGIAASDDALRSVKFPTAAEIEAEKKEPTETPETPEQAVDTTGEAAPAEVSSNAETTTEGDKPKRTLAPAGPRGKRLNRRLISLSDNSGRETILGG
jgi:hypothetical protein